MDKQNLQAISPDNRTLKGSFVGKSDRFEDVNITVGILGELIDRQL